MELNFSFNSLNTLSCSSFHLKVSESLSNSVIGPASWAYHGMKRRKNPLSPKNLLTSCLFVGVGNSCIDKTFCYPGHTPFEDSKKPR